MNKVTILADEVLIIRDGGEMPEVTFHSSLFYLSKDPEGPHIVLEKEDLLQLKEAVLQGYLRIILRDLSPENRDLGHYRGMERCRVNWNRLSRFCECEQLNIKDSCEIVSDALVKFLDREVAEVGMGLRCSSVNCSSEALSLLVESLGLGADDLPLGWQNICL